MDNEQMAKNYSHQHPEWSIREKAIAEKSFIAGIMYHSGEITEQHLLPDENGEIKVPADKKMQEGKETNHVDVLAPEHIKEYHEPEELINDAIVRGKGQEKKVGSNQSRKQTSVDDLQQNEDYDEKVSRKEHENTASKKGRAVKNK